MSADLEALDIVVSNAGFFPPTQSLADLEEKEWERSVALNLTAHTRLLKRCIPLLKLGFDPAVVFIGSKNVLAPGPGAAAYSAAKAGLMQVARIAALELGVHGIRVNTLHPDAVYDTALWTDELLASAGERLSDERRRLQTQKYTSHRSFLGRRCRSRFLIGWHTLRQNDWRSDTGRWR